MLKAEGDTSRALLCAMQVTGARAHIMRNAFEKASEPPAACSAQLPSRSFAHVIDSSFVSDVSRAKIEEVTLNALRTRQSLVKGERLVRTEVRAVLFAKLCQTAYFSSTECIVGCASTIPRNCHTHGSLFAVHLR